MPPKWASSTRTVRYPHIDRYRDQIFQMSMLLTRGSEMLRVLRVQLLQHLPGLFFCLGFALCTLAHSAHELCPQYLLGLARKGVLSDITISCSISSLLASVDIPHVRGIAVLDIDASHALKVYSKKGIGKPNNTYCCSRQIDYLDMAGAPPPGSVIQGGSTSR